MAAFAIKVERNLATEATTLAWCPSMDLLALVAAERQLPVHRLSWQRLFTLAAFDHPISAITWRPDGKMLAVSLADGSLCLYTVEDGELLAKVVGCGAEASHGTGAGLRGAVELCWLSQLRRPPRQGPALDADGLEPSAAASSGRGDLYANELGSLFPPLAPIPSQPSRVLEQAGPLQHAGLLEALLLREALPSAALDVLVSASADGIVRLWAGGRHLLAELHVPRLCGCAAPGGTLLPSSVLCASAAAASEAQQAQQQQQQQQTQQQPAVRVLRVCLTEGLGELALLLQAEPEAQLSLRGQPLPPPPAQQRGNHTLLCALVRCPLLASRSAEVAQLAQYGLQLRTLLERLRGVASLFQRCWEEGTALVLTKLRALPATLSSERRANVGMEAEAEAEGEGEAETEDEATESALLELLLTGGATPALELFLAQELSESVVARIFKAVSGCSAQLHKLSQAQLLPCAEMIAHRLASLRALLRCEERCARFAIGADAVQAALVAAGRARAEAGQLHESAQAALLLLRELTGSLGRAAVAVRGEVSGGGLLGGEEAGGLARAQGGSLRAHGGLAFSKCRALVSSVEAHQPCAPEPQQQPLQQPPQHPRSSQGGGAGPGGAGPPEARAPALGLHGASLELELRLALLFAPAVAALSADATLELLQPLCALPLPQVQAQAQAQTQSAGRAAGSGSMVVDCARLGDSLPSGGSGGSGGPGCTLAERSLLEAGVVCLFPLDLGSGPGLGFCLLSGAQGTVPAAARLGFLPTGAESAAAAAAALYRAGKVLTVSPRSEGGCCLAMRAYDVGALARGSVAPSPPCWPSRQWVADLTPAPAGAEEAAEARSRSFPLLAPGRLAVSASRGLCCLAAGRSLVTLDLEEDEEEGAEEQAAGAEEEEDSFADATNVIEAEPEEDAANGADDAEEGDDQEEDLHSDCESSSDGGDAMNLT